MTATPTPLRELLWSAGNNGDNPEHVRSLLIRAYAALSARDAAGAVECAHERSYGAPWRCAKCGYRMDDATPPASGEAVTPDRDQCGHGIPANLDAIDAYMAASGEAEAWDSLAIAHLLDERASDRGGDKLLTDAAALIRRLAAVAPAGMVLVPIEPTDRMREVMLHHGLGHRPAPDLIAKADWLWAHMLEEAQAAPTPPATAGKE